MLNAIGLANPGRERFVARDAAAVARARRAAVGVGRRLLGARIRRDVRATRGRDDRAEPLLPERRRGAGVAPRRSSPRAAQVTETRSTPSFRRMPGTWARRCARSRRRAPTVSVLVNTLRGVALDAQLQPVLARGAGGYSGPALKPVALAAVHACASRDRVADRRHGRCADRTRRARVHRVRCDARRARHGAVRRSGCAVARARASSPRRRERRFRLADDVAVSPLGTVVKLETRS